MKTVAEFINEPGNIADIMSDEMFCRTGSRPSKVEYDGWCDNINTILRRILENKNITIDTHNTYVALEYQLLGNTKIDAMLVSTNSILFIKTNRWSWISNNRFDSHKLNVLGIDTPQYNPRLQLQNYMDMFTRHFKLPNDSEQIKRSSVRLKDGEEPEKVRVHGAILCTNLDQSIGKEYITPSTIGNDTPISSYFKGNGAGFINLINAFFSSQKDLGVTNAVKEPEIDTNTNIYNSFIDYITSPANEGFNYALTDNQLAVSDAVEKYIQINDGKKRIICIKGPAGSGKTLVGLTIIKDIASETRLLCKYITSNTEIRNHMFSYGSINGTLKTDGIFSGATYNDVFSNYSTLYGEEGKTCPAIIIEEAHNNVANIKGVKFENGEREYINVFDDYLKHTDTLILLYDEHQKTNFSHSITPSYIQQYCEINSCEFIQLELNESIRNCGDDSYSQYINDIINNVGELAPLEQSPINITINKDYCELDKYISFLRDSREETQIMSLWSTDNEWKSKLYNGCKEDKDDRSIRDFSSFKIHGIKSGDITELPLRWNPHDGNCTYAEFKNRHVEGDEMIPFYMPDDGNIPRRYSFTSLPEHYKYVAYAPKIRGFGYKNVIVIIPDMVYYDEDTNRIEVDITKFGGFIPQVTDINGTSIDTITETIIRNQLTILLTRSTKNMHLVIQDEKLRTYLKTMLNGK